MDANTAIVIAATITAIPGTGALILAAIAASRSAKNGAVLAQIAPTLAQVEVNTNSNTETIRKLANINGIRVGQDEERANPTLPGTPSPKLNESPK